MAVTTKQLLNNALTVLGEDVIAAGDSSLTEAYHLLLLEFANFIKEEVEEAHNWRALRSVESVTVVANTTNIAITNANERSRLVRVLDDIKGREVPLIFDVTDTANPIPLREMDLSEVIRRNQADDTQGTPVYFALDNTSGDGLSLYVHPRPSVNTDIDITLVIPQDPLVFDSLDTVISLPTRAMKLGLLWWALEERGEELGVNTVFSQQKYQTAISDSIGLDAGEQGEWQLVPG